MSTSRARKAAGRQPAKQSANKSANRSGNKSANRSGRQGGRRRPAAGGDFWGTAAAIDDVPEPITLSEDPGGMVTSLGPPPIPGHETAAQHYFDAVYRKSAALAIALAAASGLLATDDGEDEPELGGPA
jgi:hypothetical protein